MGSRLDMAHEVWVGPGLEFPRALAVTITGRLDPSKWRNVDEEARRTLETALRTLGIVDAHLRIEPEERRP